MRKRILSGVLVLCIMLSLLPWTVPIASALEIVDIGLNATWELAFEGTTMDRYTYSHTPEHLDVQLWFVPETGTIMGASFGDFRVPNERYHLTIPKTLGGVDVKKVSSLCYDVATSRIEALASLTVPNGIQSLDGCSEAINLTSVTFLGPIELENNVFTDCTSLENVTWNRITSIGAAAFWGCSSLKHVDLPEGIILNNGAFQGCKSLTNITLPDSLTVIPRYIFAGSGLTSITLKDGCTAISSEAFAGCEDLIEVKLNDGLIEIDDYAFDGCHNLTNINIPSSVETIGDHAFAECSKLTNVTLPKRDNLKIGESAFQNSGLTSVVIPTYTTSVGGHCFSGCDKMAWVSFPNPNNRIFDVVYAVFDGCTALTDVYFDGSQEEWYYIHISDDNDPLKNATIHYNSTGPSGNPPANPDDLSIKVDVQSKSYPIKPDDNTVPFTIRVEVTNTGKNTAKGLYGSVAFDPKNSNFIVPVSTSTSIDLAPGKSTTFSWEGYAEGLSELITLGEFKLTFNCSEGTLYEQMQTLLINLDSKFHTVDFDLNHGSGSADTQIVPNFGRVTRPADPTRSGYTFNGWFIEEQNDSNILVWTDWYEDDAEGGKRVEEDITLHAGWLSNSFVYGRDTYNFENVAEDFFGASSGIGYPTKYLDDILNMDSALGEQALANTQRRINNIMQKNWRGSCFGMTSVLALILTGDLHVDYFQKGAAVTYDFDAPKNNDTVRSLINYYALMQFTNISSSRFAWSPSSPKTIISLLDNNKGPVFVEFDIRDYYQEIDFDTINPDSSTYGNGGAHVVLAYGYTQDPQTNDYIVYIWDPATKTAPYSCDRFSMLTFDSNGNNPRFKGFGAYNVFYNGLVRNPGDSSYEKPNSDHMYYRCGSIKAIFTVNDSYIAQRNLEEVLKNAGYVHAYDNGPTQTANIVKRTAAYNMARNVPESNYILYTNYPSFTIICSDGTSATVTNGQASGNLQISDALTLNDVGYDLCTAYLLPQLSADSSYQITPAASNSYVQTHALNTTLVTSYDSLVDKNGIYTSVDMEGIGTITISGDATTSTSFSTPTKHSIDVALNDVETPWYSVTAAGTSSGLTVSPASTETEVSSADNAAVTITLENTDNDIIFRPVNVDTDGVRVVEAADSEGTAIIVQDDQELQRDTMTYTVIFYPMSGAAIGTQSDIPHGSTISKPADPVRDGYKFDGWYLDSNYKTAWSFDTPVTNDFSLYAKWTESSSNPSQPSNPSSPGSSSSSSSENDPDYSISVPSGLTGGKISVTPTRASAGQRVTITATPDKGYELDSLTVTDSKGNELVLTDKGAGKYTFHMPTGKVTIHAIFKATQPLTPIWNNPFIDVAENAWYFDAVRFVNQQGLMNGTSFNTFSPDSKLTRAQLAQVLYNKSGKPYINSTTTFTDVVADAWYADAITWAASKGIISGYGNGMVGPNDFITREQLATILWRYENSPISNYALQFTDTDHISQYALNALKWAAGNGVLNGYSDGRLAPDDSANRSHVAQMLKNCFNK